MSKDIVIKLKGEPQNLNGVEKILLSGVDNGFDSVWVPEDETVLGQAAFNANGNYESVDYEVFGWRIVTVNVPMKLSGNTITGTWEINITGDSRPVLTIRKGGI